MTKDFYGINIKRAGYLSHFCHKVREILSLFKVVKCVSKRAVWRKGKVTYYGFHF
jgi:hypothetical protein